MGIEIHRIHILKHVTLVESRRVIIMESKSRKARGRILWQAQDKFIRQAQHKFDSTDSSGDSRPSLINLSSMPNC